MRKIDVKNIFFMMSFRFNKNKYEDFGLTKLNENENIYIDKSDHYKWKQKDLYDFGWGREFGFVRLPELGFLELWELIRFTKITDNVYGAASILLEKYPDEVKNEVLKLLKSESKKWYNKKMKKAFKALQLDEQNNKSSITGKSGEQIDLDFKEWTEISKEVKILFRKFLIW